METTKLKKFAQFARRSLIEQISAKLKRALSESSAARRENAEAVAEIEKHIFGVPGKETDHSHRQAQLVERVAYIWFNRFCALRFMDVNRYNRVNIVSPADPGQFQPEILADAKMGHIDEDMVVSAAVRERIFGLLQGKITSPDAQGEAYRMLVVAACNFWNKAMPFLFQHINDYTELLMPDDLLSGNSILAYTREAMTPDVCKDVEVIGWLYQFYISEKKDEVFAGLKKGKKITPENIPAATQLFTPHWIVRYLVENSLGRLWLLNRPNSKLAEKMEYYIPPVESGEVDSGKWEVGSKDESFHSPLSTSHLRISSPEEIRICDPACGSGHMLTYAFDLLYAIYEEEGYEPAEIPEKILTKNLYGIEIDERAGELAAFALTMKARARQRRFFNKAVQPNICVLENVSLDVSTIENYKKQFGTDIFSPEIVSTLRQFEEANHFGSLIRPAALDVKPALDELLLLKKRDEAKLGSENQLKPEEKVLVRAGNFRKIMQALRQADYLSPKYHVVIANPPYMGGKGMNGRVAAWLKDNYADVKSDLFSAFIVRNTELALPGGQLGFMTPFVWMFISSYEKLRTFLIDQKTITSLVQLEYSGFDGATVPICTFTVENTHQPQYRGGYVRLSDFRGSENQAPRTLEAIRNPQCGWFFRVSAADFKKIPGSPIAYWVSQNVRKVFVKGTELSKSYKPVQGLITGDTDRFAKVWYEVSKNETLLIPASKNTASSSGKKWFPYNKGGSFRKWYGNNEFVVNWKNDGAALKNFKDKRGKLLSRPQNESTYFEEGLTWTAISSSYFAVRHCPEGSIGSNAGMMVFSDQPAELKPLLGLLNSSLTTYLMSCLTQTLNFDQGIISRIPLLDRPSNSIPHRLVEIEKADWDAYETSWDFTSFPLLSQAYRQPTLAQTYAALRAHWQEMTLEMQRLEEENNRIFIDAYGLQGELTPDVPLKEITLTCNPHYRYGIEEWEVGSEKWEAMETRLLQDTMKELVSYAVGCMFGRYSLDKPGLILANQGETLADFVRKVGSEKWEVGSEGGNYGDRSKLQRVDRLAEGDGLGGIGLSGNQTISEGGTLRTDQSSQTISGFHSVQHSGRSGQKIDSGVQKLSVNSTGFQSRGRNAVNDRSTAGLYPAGERSANLESDRGNKAHDLRAKSEIDLTSTTSHSPLPTSHFLPDEDNVIPMLDGDWFTDDITERFRQFLRVAFGEEHYEENLRFVEQALNIKGKRNYSIRDYFLGEFYNDHVKRYKKRPIYWLFSSPKGSFNALIYMHRYRPDTVSVVLNDYLREFRTKLAAHKNHLEAVSISASSSQGEKTKALKEIEKITKMIAEMEEYEREVLYPLATEQVEIDLDDGVKVNYPKFGKALKKIPGLDAKED